MAHTSLDVSTYEHGENQEHVLFALQPVESSTGNLAVKAVMDNEQIQYRRQADGRSLRVSNVGFR
jgi:hypothetical protein